MPLVTAQNGVRLERWIYRCLRCKAIRARDHAAAWTRETYELHGRMSSSYRTTYGEGSTPAPEVCCGRAMSGRPVQGRRTAERCGAKCANATGHDCECSCAGRNHGNAHTA